MSQVTTVATLMMSFAACLTGVARGAEVSEHTDPLQMNSVWSGEIHQGTAVFRTTIYILGRDKDRVRGEIHFQTTGGLNKLTFQGNIVDGHTVAWITDKKEGAVTFPGLYVGTLKENSVSGIWQVPSAGQYDTFAVTLKER
jgi:hypothetical protein